MPPRTLDAPHALIVLERGQGDRLDPGEAVQVLESTDYRYEVEAPRDVHVVVQPEELFLPDSDAGTQGRFRPGTAVGRLPISVWFDGEHVGTCAVEVRAKKLGYEDAYRWMLRDIADITSEMILERFAPSEQRLAPESGANARTLYQRFAFLLALLSDDEFDAALHHIISRPYVQWANVSETRPTAQGVRLSSQTIRRLVGPGRRIPVHGLRLDSIPETVVTTRPQETLDNPPNRFVKFALQRWRAICAQTLDALTRERENYPVTRGIRQSRALLDRIDSVLAQSLFVEIGPLSHVPVANPVLRRRDGYRDVYRAWILFDVVGKLHWDGGEEEVFGAGQKNVATLYEFWVFLQLAKVARDIVAAPLDLSTLIVGEKDGLGLSLRQGREVVVRGQIVGQPRQLQLALWFNRTFGRGTGPAGSWSLQLRPDISISIGSDADPVFTEMWLHFDAKYRIDSLGKIAEQPMSEVVDVGAPDDDADEDEDDPTVAKRDDLLKMHAYRDAIKRSAGAYVIYPGETRKEFFEYHEILPGLGAFGLRPTDSGAADGEQALREFMRAVIQHASSQLTQHERLRYWTRTSTSGPVYPEVQSPAPFLRRPASDTSLLLGYVRTRGQLEWIEETRLYNLRAGDRNGAVGLTSPELGCDLVLLYGPWGMDPQLRMIEGQPRVMKAEEIAHVGYRPRGRLYVCLPLGQRVDATERELSRPAVADFVDRLRGSRPIGAPLVTDWATLIAAASRGQGAAPRQQTIPP